MSDEMSDAVPIAAALCRRFEGFRSQPYLCPAGVPTIGYGSTHYADGRRVTLNDPPVSRDAADRLLTLELRKTYLRAVQTYCPGADTPERVAALLDWTYNLGAGNLRSSTLRKAVNAGEWDRVPAQLRRWNKGGGRVLAGLVARREAEVGLLLKEPDRL